MTQSLSNNQLSIRPIDNVHVFHQFNYIGLILTGILLAWVYPQFNVDQALISPFFDPNTQSFPLKGHYFYNQIMHVYLKNMLIIIAIFTLLLGLFGQRFQYFNTRIRQHQSRLIWTFICLVLACIEVAYLKSISAHGCPNDLRLYGGELPLLTLFEALPPHIKAGHCFPGGHASAGFAFMSFYFTFRTHAPTFSRLMLWLSITLGLVMGWTQMVRGEHFLSHNLWTGWFVWLTLFSLDYFHYIFSNRKHRH